MYDKSLGTCRLPVGQWNFRTTGRKFDHMGFRVWHMKVFPVNYFRFHVKLEYCLNIKMPDSHDRTGHQAA